MELYSKEKINFYSMKDKLKTCYKLLGKKDAAASIKDAVLYAQTK